MSTLQESLDLIDTHSHLQFTAYDSDRAAVIARAIAGGVRRMLVVGVDESSSRLALALAQRYPQNLFPTVGMHPHYLGKKAAWKELEELAVDPNVRAIGEVGLDLFRPAPVTLELQRMWLARFFEFAHASRKPLIIHCRAAFGELLDFLKRQTHLPRVVMHCFSGTWEVAERLLGYGFYLSFTGIVTFSRDPEIARVITNTPLKRIMVETDAPFLTPAVHRGERNEPLYVLEVARKIAMLKGVDLKDVAAATTANACALFGLK